MDWNLLLFAARWVMIALIYLVLMLLLTSVYRETSALQVMKKEEEAKIIGRLRVINPGSDTHLLAGTLVHLNRVNGLGTAPDNDIILGDMFVSGHHFLLRWDGRRWWVEDLNSKNGTWINGQPLTPAQPQVIHPGAAIAAGDMLLELTV
jgi:pSer/pThr/pTyr-binding forkhead associated (FHA) protein